MKLSLLMSHASVLQYHDGRIRVWRHRRERILNSCVMHRHTGLTPGIMVGGGIGYHSRTPLVRIAGTLNSQRCITEVLEPVVFTYLQGLATVIFNRIMRDHTWHVLSKGSSSITGLDYFPVWLALQNFADSKLVVPGCSMVGPDYSPSCHSRSTLATCGSSLVCCTPRTHPKYL
ncbi:transposable element Tcb1 transposase [Trichonephila clavipes]|nr:transposable element Tcb1 transposase [Trichonephila clavipes]